MAQETAIVPRLVGVRGDSNRLSTSRNAPSVAPDLPAEVDLLWLCCKDWRQSEVVAALRRSGGCCEMVVEHAHGLRQRRGPNAKSSPISAPRP